MLSLSAYLDGFGGLTTGSQSVRMALYGDSNGAPTASPTRYGNLDTVADGPANPFGPGPAIGSATLSLKATYAIGY